jgi:hypothetical protein
MESVLSTRVLDGVVQERGSRFVFVKIERIPLH